MPLAPAAIALIREFEGLHTLRPDGTVAPYLCPAKVPTIGIGTTVWPDGRKVSMGDAPITPARAEEVLQFDIDRKYAPPVDTAVTVAMHSLMRGACVSLAYNIGTGAFRKSTALRMINQQRWSEVPRAFKMYRMGGGRVLAGLERRRVAESLMFMAGVKALASGTVEAPVIPLAVPGVATAAKSTMLSRFLSLVTSKAA